MPETPRCTAAIQTNSPRGAGGAGRAGWPSRAASRVPALLLASALLLAPALAVAQGTAQPSPTGTAAPDATPPAAMPGGSGMAPTRMPRPGSGATFERGEAGHSGRRTAEQRFEEANTTHDGHLTEAQAQSAHMRGVATHFAEIDSHHRGYITFEEIGAWRAERRAERKAAREKAGK